MLGIRAHFMAQKWWRIIARALANLKVNKGFWKMHAFAFCHAWNLPGGETMGGLRRPGSRRATLKPTIAIAGVIRAKRASRKIV